MVKDAGSIPAGSTGYTRRPFSVGGFSCFRGLNAVLLDFELRDGEDFDEELIRQTLELGEVFGKQAEAEHTVEDFTKAVQRARDAYNPDQSVMALNVSGGEIGYVAPGIGRTWGPLFDLIGSLCSGEGWPASRRSCSAC